MSKPFHVYLDLDVFNNSTDFTSKAPQLSFEETRTQPFLDGTADDYFVAIARFSIQTGETLPALIHAIDTTQTDINRTVYKITLMYKGVSAGATIIYTPQPSHDQVKPPKGPNGQDFSGNYYYIYNYQDWITMVNRALLTAHILLISHVRGTPGLANDGFLGQAAAYTEAITMKNEDGTPITSFTILSATAPSYRLGITQSYPNSDGTVLNVITTIVTGTSSQTTPYSTTYTINNTDGTAASSATNVAPAARHPI